MRCLEEIHLRLSGGCPEALLAELARLATRGEDAGRVRVYRHALVPTDLRLHLDTVVHKEGCGPSELGLRLAAALREHGLVEHTVWIAEPEAPEGGTR